MMTASDFAKENAKTVREIWSYRLLLAVESLFTAAFLALTWASLSSRNWPLVAVSAFCFFIWSRAALRTLNDVLPALGALLVTGRRLEMMTQALEEMKNTIDTQPKQTDTDDK